MYLPTAEFQLRQLLVRGFSLAKPLQGEATREGSEGTGLSKGCLYPAGSATHSPTSTEYCLNPSIAIQATVAFTIL